MEEVLLKTHLTTIKMMIKTKIKESLALVDDPLSSQRLIVWGILVEAVECFKMKLSF